jgi:hypothetical protein
MSRADLKRTSAAPHVTGVDGTTGGQQLVLRLSTRGIPVVSYLTGADWFDVHGERCSVDGKCEECTHARVWLNNGKGRIKRVSGKYEVDSSGQHLENADKLAKGETVREVIRSICAEQHQFLVSALIGQLK